MSSPRLLVCEGNTAELRAKQVEAGGVAMSDGYADLLRKLLPDAVVDICYPADPGANLPLGGIEGYDGVAITGSALNVYDGGPAIEPQIELARAVLKSKTPLFGSCWGLQVVTVAAGGTVRPNPKGREIGIGRRIALTQAGREHPMYAGKAGVFDAVTVHLDEVETLAPGTTVLASNAVSDVQSAEIKVDGATAWCVQYHPEFTLRRHGGDRAPLRAAPDRRGLFRGRSGAQCVRGGPADARPRAQQQAARLALRDRRDGARSARPHRRARELDHASGFAREGE